LSQQFLQGTQVGTYSIYVTAAGATLNAGINFSVIASPQITSVQWNPFAVGGTQCVTGNTFGATPGTVTVNGFAATVTSWTPIWIVAPGRAYACENNNNYVYNFWSCKGYPQYPDNPNDKGAGGQFFYVDVPGHPIHWPPSNVCWLENHGVSLKCTGN
jgi:hypothetical protein